MQLIAKTFQQATKKGQLKEQQIMLRDYIISYNFRKNIKMEHFFNWLKQQRGITEPALYWELNDGLNNNFEKHLDERVKNAKKMVRSLIDDDRVFAVIQKIFEELKNFFIEHLSSNRKNIELIKSIFNTHKPQDASSIAYAPMVNRSSKHPTVFKEKLQFNKYAEKGTAKLSTARSKESVKDSLPNTYRATSLPKQLQSAHNFIRKQQLQQQKSEFLNKLTQKTRQKTQQSNYDSQKKYQKSKYSYKKKNAFQSEEQNPEQIPQSRILSKDKGFEEVLDAFDQYGIINIERQKQNNCRLNRQPRIQKKTSMNYKRSKSEQPQKSSLQLSQSLRGVNIEKAVQEISFEQMRNEIRQRQKDGNQSQSQSKQSILNEQLIQSAKRIQSIKRGIEKGSTSNIKLSPSIKQKEPPKSSRVKRQSVKQQQSVQLQKDKRRQYFAIKTAEKQQKIVAKSTKLQSEKFQSNFKDKQVNDKKKQLRKKQTESNRDLISLGKTTYFQIQQLRMSHIEEDSDQDRNQQFDDPFKVLEFFGL